MRRKRGGQRPERRPSGTQEGHSDTAEAAVERSIEPQSSRRSFLWKAWFGLAAVALVEAAWVVIDLLKPRRVVADETAVVTAGPVERFEPGSVTAFPQGKFYLVRLDDGGFLAVSRECTHLGCTVPWVEAERQFVCPCHASAFDLRGDVINPPAPRALDRFEVRIENSVVKVNTANRERRAAFTLGQVTRS